MRARRTYAPGVVGATTATVRVCEPPGGTSPASVKRWSVAQPSPMPSLLVPKWMPRWTGLEPPAFHVCEPVFVTVTL